MYCDIFFDFLYYMQLHLFFCFFALVVGFGLETIGIMKHFFPLYDLINDILLHFFTWCTKKKLWVIPNTFGDFLPVLLHSLEN